VYDLILVGGGLANSLIALRLKARRPELRVLLLERGATLGAKHTWSFFSSDVSDEALEWLQPLVVHRWPGYVVRFPELRRRLATGYQSVSSERLHQVVKSELGKAVRLRSDVVRVEPGRVTLKSGETIRGTAVIEGRGPEPSPELVLAWQKFIGRTLRLEAPHGLTEPIVMDATVPQLDGYRFVYVLPFDEHRLLVEDTYYSDGPELERKALRARVDAYALSQGWRVAEVEQEEEGVLPIALGGDMNAFWAGAAVARSGLRAGLFHPTTGYSLPDAVKLAETVAAADDLSQEGLLALTRRHAVQTWRARGFYRLLNRMLFKACAPEERWRVLQRFYRLPEPLIERFYAGDSTAADAARVLIGKPPVPVGRALTYLSEGSVRAKA
jgi:lycopene beta-cyclase